MAHLHFLERDLANEQADLFALIRAAMHADDKQAEAFTSRILNP